MFTNVSIHVEGTTPVTYSAGVAPDAMVVKVNRWDGDGATQAELTLFGTVSTFEALAVSLLEHIDATRASFPPDTPQCFECGHGFHADTDHAYCSYPRPLHTI
jgi:hypothetical protein